MGKYATLTELAKSLGVAPSTVSRALQDHPRISKQMKELIRQRVMESGFVPNKYAQVLKDNRTRMVGVVVPDLTPNFYSRVLSAIYAQFHGTGYSIVLGHSEERLENEVELVEKFLSLRVDGVIAALSKESNHVRHFEKLIRQGIPLVFYDRVSHFLETPRIISDDYEAAFKATEHLIKTGCKTIAHITASRNLNNSNNRLYGYLDALKANGLDMQEDLIFYYEFDQSSIERFLQVVLMNHPNLDGLFVFNDYAAYTAIHHLLKLGKRIPDEISVIGFSNEPISDYMTPQLSTVGDIASTMGHESARVLLHNMEHEDQIMSKVVLKQELVLKETTRHIQT